MQKRFTVIDEGFVCAVCGGDVPPLGYTARDHCPRCLSSLHLDIFPGDRANGCGGVLAPVGVEASRGGNGGYRIVYRCRSCGEVKKNVAAADDDMERIIEISANAIGGDGGRRKKDKR